MLLNPFRSLDQPPSRPLTRVPVHEAKDRVRRAKQEKLGVGWKERHITTERLRARGIRVSREDVDRYAFVREKHRAMKGTEEPGWAEWMLLEGADSQGGVADSTYNWFGDSVLAFSPHKMDDVLHRTDVLLFFLDEENERKAYPIAVDVTVHEAGMSDKIEKDFDALSPSRTFLSSAYWIDTASDTAGEAIDEPKEGRIQTVPVSIYLPSADVERFRHPNTSLATADAIMRRLKPFVLEQMRIEMEAELLYLLGEVQLVSLRSGNVRIRIRTREELLDVLKRQTAFSGTRERGREILTNALQIIWKEQERIGRPDPGLVEKIPTPLRRIAALLPDVERARIAVA